MGNIKKTFLKNAISVFAIATIISPVLLQKQQNVVDAAGPWSYSTNTTFTNPNTGVYSITAAGAKGNNEGNLAASSGRPAGGKGGTIEGKIGLNKAATLYLETYNSSGGGSTGGTNTSTCTEYGTPYSGGQGGKSSLVRLNNASGDIILAAGGGGGAGGRGNGWREAGNGGDGGWTAGRPGNGYHGSMSGGTTKSAGGMGGKGGSTSGTDGSAGSNYSGGAGGAGGQECHSDNWSSGAGGGAGGENYLNSSYLTQVSSTIGGNSTDGGSISITELGSFSMTAPINGATIGNNNVTLSWSTSGSITATEVKVGTTSGAIDIVPVTSKGTTTYHSFNVPTELTTNKTFYWSVRIQSGGVWSPWQETSFVYQPPLISTITPANGTSFQDSFIDINWTGTFASGASLGAYEFKAGKTPGETDILIATNKGTNTSHRLNIPAGTAGNTTIYLNVRAQNNQGYWGPWKQQTVVFSNNVPVIGGTFTTGEKDLTVSLDKRIMNFRIATLVDPDTFNYVKIFGEVVGVTGSKKQLGVNLTGPVSWTAKNYKLKLVPNFQPTGSTYDVLVVDSANENTVIATLIDNRPMQASNASAPESFTFRFYAEDYQNTTNGVLSTSNLVTQAITIDTRNYLPRTYSVTHDVNNRIMSANQGFNRVKVSGTVEDLDPADGIDVYYTVKLATDLVAGKYVVNPATDTKISTIPSNGTVARGAFNATYTITESLANGNYVLLVYGKDTRGGIGDPTIINFTVNKTNPDIRFYSQYGGNTLATAQRQILAKNSKLKMYFSAYDFTTFEYAGYVVRPNQQTTTGSYEDLKIRGAFTNDVPSQFIGVDLSDPLFNKGDMLVFKFRAISSTGVKIEKDVRILIGDQNNTMTDVGDARVPTPLRVQ